MSSGRHGRVSLSPGKQAIPCKWVLKSMKGPNTNDDKKRARSVIRGFRQQYATDFEDTYFPIVRTASIHPVLSYVAAQKWFIHPTAFLYADLEEEVYMTIPKGTEPVQGTS